MNPLLELIIKIFARKFADKHLAKAETGNEPAAQATVPAAPKVSPFKNYWNLEERKTTGQAIVTFLFFLFITCLMDAVVFIPFRDREEVGQIMDYVRRFPPSLFAGMALMVMVMAGREIAVWKKGLIAAFAAAGGILTVSCVALLPVIYLLRLSLKDEIKAVEPEVAGEAAAPQAEEKPVEAKADDKPVPTLSNPADSFSDPLADFIKKK